MRRNIFFYYVRRNKISHTNSSGHIQLVKLTWSNNVNTWLWRLGWPAAGPAATPGWWPSWPGRWCKGTGPSSGGPPRSIWAGEQFEIEYMCGVYCSSNNNGRSPSRNLPSLLWQKVSNISLNNGRSQKRNLQSFLWQQIQFKTNWNSTTYIQARTRFTEAKREISKVYFRYYPIEALPCSQDQISEVPKFNQLTKLFKTFGHRFIRTNSKILRVHTHSSRMISLNIEWQPYPFNLF